MTPAELFDHLRAQGATLLERDGLLRVSPSALALAHAEEIRANKMALIWLVRKHRAAIVHASEWPTICCWCGKWQEWTIKQGLYRCQYCGNYFKFKPKEKLLYA